MTPVMQKYRMEQYVQERTRKMKVIEIKGNKTKSRIKEQQKDEKKHFKVWNKVKLSFEWLNGELKQ